MKHAKLDDIIIITIDSTRDSFCICNAFVKDETTVKQ